MPSSRADHHQNRCPETPDRSAPDVKHQNPRRADAADFGTQQSRQAQCGSMSFMTTLTIAEAVPLGAAFAMRLAESHGFRALLVKGAVLEAQGLRGSHESMDVDVWVDPADHQRYLQALASHGWTPLIIDEHPALLSDHAVTVFHVNWPITLDVHHRFPGFLASPQTVFDTLWSSRSSFSTAGIPVAVPSAPAHAALAALHYLRNPKSGLLTQGLPDLEIRAPQTLGTHGLEELSATASQTGAGEPLADFLHRIGAPIPATAHDLDSEAVNDWSIRQNDIRGSKWLRTLITTPWTERPALLWQASRLSARRIDPLRRAGESRTSARLRRLRDVFGTVRPALIHARSEHRQNR